MAIELKKIELETTERIINKGLNKAADSLSFLVKEEVFIEVLDIKINPNTYLPISKRINSGKNYLLSTTIKGDIGGDAYLILNQYEVDCLINKNFSNTLINNTDEIKNMTEAFLLELDNILSASVITQFANSLQCRLYGDVPVLKILNYEELNPFLDKKNLSNSNIIYLNSRFSANGLDINPEFIWIMNNIFFTKMKNIIND